MSIEEHIHNIEKIVITKGFYNNNSSLPKIVGYHIFCTDKNCSYEKDIQ